MVLAGTWPNMFRRRVLARPSLSIIWAETWARLLTHLSTVAKKFRGPGMQWVKFGGELKRLAVAGSCLDLHTQALILSPVGTAFISNLC